MTPSTIIRPLQGRIKTGATFTQGQGPTLRYFALSGHLKPETRKRPSEQFRRPFVFRSRKSCRYCTNDFLQITLRSLQEQSGGLFLYSEHLQRSIFGRFHLAALRGRLVLEADEVEDAVDDEAMQLAIVRFTQLLGISAYGVQREE